MNNIDQLSVTTIRSLIVDSVEHAQHGHMGMPLGAASMAYELFINHMNMNPENPNWFNRDRFILASGHGSILQYSLLNLSGYNVSIEDLKSFRKNNSNTPGHPEVGDTDGVEATTGPLGQGVSMAVGFALAEAHLADRFNKEEFDLVDHYTYTICGDGDLVEGVAIEASEVAGSLGLGKLIVLHDSNDITSDGPVELSSSVDIHKKYEAMNWHTLLVKDGNDLEEISAAIEEAKAVTDKPTLIEVKTIIGFGSNLQGTSDIHSDPVGEEEAEHIKKTIGWDASHPPFHVPEEVKENFERIKENGHKKETEWNELLEGYKSTYPELYEEFIRALDPNVELSEDVLKPFTGDKLATRSASGEVLNRIYKEYPYLVGGSADLASSNKTEILDQPYMSRNDHAGPNVHFGVREFGMASIANGITLHGGLKGYVGTFLIFSDYMRSAIRLAALMETPTTFVMTHDSIHLGQDGPTHQPIEQLVSLRAIPNLVVYRPADANETAVGWKLAVESKESPYLLALGRHDVPVLDEVSAEAASKGGYTLSKSEDTPELILIATGSEVEVALQVKDLLDDVSVNVVSMPSWELFDQQDEDYRRSVLPPEVTKRVSIELGSSIGWERYTGPEGLILGLDHFGKSAPGVELIEEYEFTAKQIAEKVRNKYFN